MEVRLPDRIKLIGRASFNPLATEQGNQDGGAVERDPDRRITPHSQKAKELLPDCGACGKKTSPYKCTKCSLPYCSVQCYRDHNKNECSEDFYKKAAEDYMKNKKSGMSDKVDTAKLLLDHQKKLREMDSGMEGSESGLTEDTSNASSDKLGTNYPSEHPIWLEEEIALNLLEKLQNGELDVQSLSHQEQLMFERFLKQEAPKVIEECKPIWEFDEGVVSFRIQALEISPDVPGMSAVPKDQTEVVPESTLDAPKQSGAFKDVPSEAKRIDLTELWAEDEETFDPERPNMDSDQTKLKAKRAELHKSIMSLPKIGLLSKLSEDKLSSLSYNIVNVVSATAYLYRYLNGDLLSQHTQVARSLVKLAPCLRNDWREYYPSPKHAFRYDLLVQMVGINNKVLLERVAKDTAAILKHQFKLCEVLYLAYDCLVRELNHVEVDPTDLNGKQGPIRMSGNASYKLTKAHQELNSTIQKLVLMITQARDLPDAKLQILQQAIADLGSILSNPAKEDEELIHLRLPK